MPIVATAKDLPLPTVAISDRVYDVPGQDPKYPLKTKISPEAQQQLSKFFVFTKADKTQIIKLRSILQPLADLNDPIALFWLAKTYDLFEFGIGDDKDAIVALKYYTKAADLGMARVEYFLTNVYRYSFMGVPKDVSKVMSYLNRAKLHGNNEVKVEVLLELARLSNPDSDDYPVEFRKYIPKSMTALMTYLQQAHAIDPHDTTVADWYGGNLYDAKRYSEALKVLINSDNPSTWKKIGRMYELGQGTNTDIAKALTWYKKMAIDGKKMENDLNPLSMYGKIEIYRLICLKKVTAQQAKPIYTPEDYEQVFSRYADEKCKYSP